MADWLDVLKGDKSIDEFQSLLSESAAQLDALLKSEPQTEQRVLGILGRHIAGTVGPESWDAMLKGLKYPLGDELTYMLAWLVDNADETAEKMTNLREYASPAVMSFFGVILGVHGEDLQRAHDAWNQLPGDWSSISREIFLDQISQTHRIVVRVKKFSGDEISVEGPPSSIVTLTTSLLITLRLIGQPNALPEGQVETLLDAAVRLIAFLGKKDRLIEILDAQEQESEASG